MQRINQQPKGVGERWQVRLFDHIAASASSVGGMSSWSVLAVLRLITNSNFEDCTTGNSAGSLMFDVDLAAMGLRLVAG